MVPLNLSQPRVALINHGQGNKIHDNGTSILEETCICGLVSISLPHIATCRAPECQKHIWNRATGFHCIPHWSHCHLYPLCVCCDNCISYFRGLSLDLTIYVTAVRSEIQQLYAQPGYTAANPLLIITGAFALHRTASLCFALWVGVFCLRQNLIKKLLKRGRGKKMQDFMKLHPEWFQSD